MRTKIHPGRLVPLLLTLALVFGASPAVAGQIQDFDPDFYVSDLTGMEIEVSGPVFEITEAELQQYPTGEGEIVHVGSETLAGNLEISFFDDGDSAQESVDIYLQSISGAADSIDVIDRGVSGDLYYALAVIEYDAVDIVYYLQVEEDIQGNVDMLQAILTTTLTLETDLVDAQGEVFVDGTPFMDNIDPVELADLLTGEGSSDGTELATPADPVNTFTFEDSGVDVGIGPDFSFIGEPEQRTDVEAVRIQGPNTLSMIAVGQTGSTSDVVLNSFSSGIESSYAGSEVVEEEVGDDYAWRLLAIPQELEEPTFMLIIVDVDIVPGYELMHAHEVPSDNVAGSLAIIQEQVSLNGAPLMPEIDPEEIAEMAADASTGESTQTSETPEATEPTTDERSGDPREDARLPESGDAGEEDEGGNTSETGGSIEATVEPTEEPTSDDADVPGELTDSSWEGEVHGHLIEWDAATWFVDTGYEGDLVSDEASLEDTIVLQTETAGETSWMYISVYGGDDSTPQDYLDHWVSDEYLSSFAESGAEADVVDSRTRGGSSAVLIRVTTESGNEYLVVRQAVALESGAVLIVTLDSPAVDMIATYETAQEVTMDGESVLYVFSPSQIQRSAGD